MNKTIAAVVLVAGIGTLPAPASAATYLARIVSRANCMVPLPRITPPATEATFFESVSWDPKFWNGHRMHTVSEHYRSSMWGGIWNRVLIGFHDSGAFDQAMRSLTWRSWAGTVERGNTSESPGPNARSVRWVVGRHWELLDKATIPHYRETGALDCDITTW
jgi:hypothetical protein